MIDIHCHILPGIDDGAGDLEEALAMARISYEDGVRHIIATPHYNSVYAPDAAFVRASVEQLQQALDEAAIGITLHAGQEVQLAGAAELTQIIENQSVQLLGPTGSFVLLEEPWSGYHPDSEKAVRYLTGLGITPIIPHPERHAFFRDEPELLTNLISLGAWTQVSADSLAGNYNKEAQAFAEWLVDQDLAFTLATDAHNIKRKPNLSAGYRIVAERVGEERTEAIRERMRRIVPKVD
ncbi:tyrosine protein phosphatase [Paenibacillus sp. J31TS4]|uniref:tyrosine-protein phosphatase n=1 Tax=Paenibacillus sp. J31TS4 TaxID=2807195 RepID=UPI001AFED997|nr:CpsB/CapC family capsule biosynthesis tyrosine phosphatase [Paenibacillus sp. J31TS4]GIP41060.1 tyrosine protein phosphatase [Paenibacillus sp. J31TS4]